jgi:beta-N-acetylhexosaminidase
MSKISRIFSFLQKRPTHRKYISTRLLTALMLISLLAVSIAPAMVSAQGNDPAAELMRHLAPEEKVGQLFLVNFSGTDASEISPIYDLIANYHVGGVVMTAANDNFVAEKTPQEAQNLTNALQQIERDSADNPATNTKPHTYVPLFVGISQEGGGAPNDQILNGLTPIPDQMAIGATWDRNLSEQAGKVMGNELSALGFNLYLGLSLDVLTLPDPAVSADLNTRVFGGDPYWARISHWLARRVEWPHGGCRQAFSRSRGF